MPDVSQPTDPAAGGMDVDPGSLPLPALRAQMAAPATLPMGQDNLRPWSSSRPEPRIDPTLLPDPRARLYTMEDIYELRRMQKVEHLLPPDDTDLHRRATTLTDRAAGTR